VRSGNASRIVDFFSKTFKDNEKFNAIANPESKETMMKEIKSLTTIYNVKKIKLTNKIKIDILKNLNKRLLQLNVSGGGQSGGADEMCPICMEDVDDTQPQTNHFNCIHTNFHEDCILAWTQQNNTCPLCRAGPVNPVNPVIIYPPAPNIIEQVGAEIINNSIQILIPTMVLMAMIAGIVTLRNNGHISDRQIEELIEQLIEQTLLALFDDI
jgi:hypothetical protein